MRHKLFRVGEEISFTFTFHLQILRFKLFVIYYNILKMDFHRNVRTVILIIEQNRILKNESKNVDLHNYAIKERFK